MPVKPGASGMEQDGHEKQPLLSPSPRGYSLPEWLPMLVCFLLISFVIAWLFLSGRVYDVVNWLHANRGIGFAVIMLLYLPIGTPFAFGYSVLTAAVGFVFGFPLGMVPILLGVWLSITANYFLLRYSLPFA